MIFRTQLNVNSHFLTDLWTI